MHNWTGLAPSVTQNDNLSGSELLHRLMGLQLSSCPEGLAEAAGSVGKAEGCVVVGRGVGSGVGRGVGSGVGNGVGAGVGRGVGGLVGLGVGSFEGAVDGLCVGHFYFRTMSAT